MPKSKNGSESMIKTIGKSTGLSIRMVALATVVLMAFSIPASACTYSIGDRVWEDTNMNGIQDKEENGLPNVHVELYKEGQTVALATTTTNSNGYYIFNNLPTGKYYVKFITPEEYVFSPQDQGTNDAKDSDANIQTGITNCINLYNSNICTVDAGMYHVENTQIPEFQQLLCPWPQ